MLLDGDAAGWRELVLDEQRHHRVVEVLGDRLRIVTVDAGDELTTWVKVAAPELEAKLAGHWDEVQVMWAAALARARETWPQLTVSTETMVTAMARAVRDSEKPLAALGELEVADLLLAQACASGSAEAIAAFTTTCGPAIAGSLRTMGLADDVIADVTQEVTTKLFVGSPPKIATYSGRALLRSWARTIATRAAVDRMRKSQPESAPDEMLYALPDAGGGPELDHFRARYASEFKEAFEAALASLEVRERNLLRHHFIDTLPFEDIGALYGVHKTTAFRWVETARDKLSKRTRNHFQERVQLPPPDVESVLRMLQSQIDLSLSRVLS